MLEDSLGDARRRIAYVRLSCGERIESTCTAVVTEFSRSTGCI